MNPRRFKAPDADGAILAAPPLSETGDMLGRNARSLGAWDYDFQGKRADWLRPRARAQIFAKARSYLSQMGIEMPGAPDSSAPLIVTGHQPELFHPGVWVKNFAVARMAGDNAGVGLNLIVDNDIPKSSSIRVPRLEQSAIQVQRVEYDEWGGEVPFEELRVRDEQRFASFPERVHGVLGGAVDDPLIDTFWPRAVQKRTKTKRIGERFAPARREVEGSWGAHNLEIPLSSLCETDPFLWFTAHLLAHLPRFQTVHNEALANYRTLYGIRSKHHPVPALGRRGEWLEAPFWVWRAEEPRRRPLLARQLSRTMELRVDGEDAPLMELPLSPDREACCAVDQLLTLPSQKVRLRTRALTTTMFARLLLGDLFVHGIGGAKYDELGDEVIHRFFGLEPPDYLTLSMTLWLSLGSDPASPERLYLLERKLRDLSFNPDRELPPDSGPEATSLVQAKKSAISGPIETHRQRLERFVEIRRCNEALQPWVDNERRDLLDERSRVRAALYRNSLARSREYALVLHSEARLREAMGGIVPGLSGT